MMRFIHPSTMTSRHGAALRYGCAVISVALAVWCRLLLDPVMGGQLPVFTLFLAVLLTAWYGGLQPALVAVALSGAAAQMILLRPRGAITVDFNQIALVAFLGTGAGIALLGGSMHSARRRAESAAESSRNQAALIEQTFDAVLVWDWGGPITFWNPAAERLYGFSRQDAIGRVSHDLLKTSTPGGIDSVLDVLRRELSWEGELHHISQDGRRLIVSSRMVMIHAADRRYILEINRDITARKQMETSLRAAKDSLEMHVQERTAELALINQSLRAERDRFAKIVAAVPVVICSFLRRPDGSARFPFANPRLELIYGVSPKELEADASPAFAKVHPDDAEGLQASIDESARTLNPWRCDFRVSHPTRGYIWVEGHSVPQLESNGDILWLGYNADINDRKLTEQALRAAEANFGLLIEGVADHAIFMLDPAGHVVTWNSGAERIDGYTGEEIIGRHFSCLFTPEGIAAGKPEEELALAAAQGKADVDGWRVRKNGSRFWANGTVAALYDDQRQVRGFAKVTRDRTAKRRNDELLRSVLDNTLDAIIGIDDQGVISMINRAGETMFGHPEAEAIGNNVKMLMPAPHRESHGVYIDSYLRTGDAKVIGIGRELSGLRKDGSTFPLDLAVTEFRLDNQRFFVGIVRDISERKRLETQLHQSQKMEAFGQLAGGVAHDFNNLLTVISGYSDLLLTVLPAEDVNREMVSEISRAGDRAASLTRQLLAFTRQQVLEPRIVDLNAIVKDTEAMLRRLIGEDVHLSSVLRKDISSVKVDPGQIEQVIMNLAVNARDAMPRGGQLTIETGDLEIAASYALDHPDTRPGRYVLLAISDTGSGMSPDVKARIFEPFFTTKGGKGTGLGLAVVQGIVKQSGGSIEIYSEIGVGTSFKIYLPAISERSPTEAVSSERRSPHGSETILLVEDEDSVRDLAVVALKGFGYRLFTASRASAALQFMDAHGDEVHLLVTDVVMPGMSGRKLAEALHASHPKLKVLFLSGYTDDAVVRHGVLQANVAFLQKPFSPLSLARKVREVLDSQALAAKPGA